MKKEIPSIKELREICLPNYILSGRSQSHLFNRICTRQVSIYLTKLFLHMGISANQTTMLSMFIVALGALLMSVGDIYYMIAGAIVLFLFPILDSVDGEIARYKKSKDIFSGRYMEVLSHPIARALIFAGWGVGLYNATGNILPILCSGLLIIGFLINTSIEFSLYTTLCMIFKENAEFRNKYFGYIDNKGLEHRNIYSGYENAKKSFISSFIDRAHKSVHLIVKEGIIINIILLSLIVTLFIPWFSIYSLELTPAMLPLLFYTLIYGPMLMVKILVIKKLLKTPRNI